MRALISAVAIACATRLGAQATDTSKIVLDHLRTPTSPAFTLLGVNPSSIARPSTPRALATELVSSSNRGTLLPNNYAVEFAPFWLVPRPAETFANYVDPGVKRSVRQSLSISLATARPDTGADSLTTQLALGARALILPGQASKRFLAVRDTMRLLQSASNRAAVQYLDAVDTLDARHQRLEQLRRDSVAAPDDAARQRIAGQLAATRQGISAAREDTARHSASIRKVVDSLGVLAKALGKADAERVGTFFELAGAIAAAYPDATFEGGKFSRAGIWGTLTRRVEKPKVDLIALARFVRNLTADSQNVFELGGRLHWARGPLALSSEWLHRTTADEVSSTPATGTYTLTFTSSSRLVGIIDYRAADNMYITTSFGRDYRDLGETRHPLVARFGMQLAYGDKPVVAR